MQFHLLNKLIYHLQFKQLFFLDLLQSYNKARLDVSGQVDLTKLSLSQYSSQLKPFNYSIFRYLLR
jgi:hypothetical protein